MDHRQWVVYLIRCSDGSLYCGITNNLKYRMLIHNSGRGAKYTRTRRPVELVGSSSAMTKSDALKLEYRIKQVPASKKNFELTKEEPVMKNLKKNLNAVNKNLKALAQKVDKIVIAVGKLEKPKVAKQPKAKVVKRKPARKTVTKKVAVKKFAARKTTKTAIDTVLGIIKKYKKGTDTVALMKKTGFNAKKIQNIIFKLKKQGKIKSEVKGIYLLA